MFLYTFNKSFIFCKNVLRNTFLNDIIHIKKTKTKQPHKAEIKKGVFTMKRTNSKELKETIKNFIMDHFCNCYYPDNKGYFSGDIANLNNIDTTNYSEVCNAILTIFFDEKLKRDNRYNAGRVTRYSLFVDWCSGLCSALPTEYYYNVCAVDLLGGWLDQTESEKAKYTESQAEEKITALLYRELTSNATRTGILY